MVLIKPNEVAQIKNILKTQFSAGKNIKLIDTYMYLRHFQASKMEEASLPYDFYSFIVLNIQQFIQIFTGDSIGIKLSEDKDQTIPLLYSLKLKSEQNLEVFLLGLHLILEELFAQRFIKKTKEKLSFEPVGQKPTADQIEKSLASYKSACEEQSVTNNSLASKKHSLVESVSQKARVSFNNHSARKSSIGFILNSLPEKTDGTSKESPLKKRLTYKSSNAQALNFSQQKTYTKGYFMSIGDKNSDRSDDDKISYKR